MTSNIIATDIPSNKQQSLEPAIDPNARPTFLLDWELTLKCNLDCSYCPTGPDGYHWNSAPHPEYEDCLRTIDFLYEYADVYMEHKAPWTRSAVLNIYGGESLFHPRIVDILEQVRKKHKPYQDRWNLKVTCTTNGIVKPKIFHRVSDLIDEFTMSFHTESSPGQKQLFRDNLLYLQHNNRDFKCIVLMHNDPECWKEDIEFIEFCKHHNMNYLPRQLDGTVNNLYNREQLDWFEHLYGKSLDNGQLSKTGRACCGGRKICTNGDLKNPEFFISDNNFKDWYCGVNWMFVYVRQFNKAIYANKDCRVNFDSSFDPIGHMDNYEELVTWTRDHLEKGTLPVVKCIKNSCWCGLCAPKAKDLETYRQVMHKHLV